MHGTIKWNFLFGGAGAVLTLLVSMPHNIWFTALTRSLYAFVIFFLLTYAIRWWLQIIAPADTESTEAETGESGVGSKIDLQTPDDADPLHALKQKDGGTEPGESGDPFQPLNPPKLATKPEQSPEQMADALRRMSEE